MSAAGRPEVTLHTLHQDLREVRVLLTVGLRAFPTDWPGEMLRMLRDGNHLLRENNRLSEERFAQLDVRLREQAIETHTILRAVAEGQRQMVDTQHRLVESQHQLVEGQRQLVEGQRQLSAEMRALIARIDALIRGRGDGSPPG